MSFENDENQSFNNPMSWENNVFNGESRLNVGPNAYIVQRNSISENNNNQNITNTTLEQRTGMQSMFNTQSENVQSERQEPTENSRVFSTTSPSTIPPESSSVAIAENSSNQNTTQTNTQCSDNDNQNRSGNSIPFISFITRREPVSKYSKTPSEQMIIFSDRAYNAIISEAFAKHPVETGGILIGHVLNNGFWIVTEVIPPGKSSINEYAYFEYDTSFVNYVANRVAIQFEIPPRVLGLWHRHPGSMDYFSSTDDGTNKTFASLDNSNGAVSALVNIDPDFRITIYHATVNPHTGVRYEKMSYEVGDELIPEEYFKLKYYPELGKNPALPHRQRHQTSFVQQSQQNDVTVSETTSSVTNQTNTVENRIPFQEGNEDHSDSHSKLLTICSSLLTFVACVVLAFCLISCVMTVHAYYQNSYHQHKIQREIQREHEPQKYGQSPNVDDYTIESIPETPIHVSYHTSDNSNVVQSKDRPTTGFPIDNNFETIESESNPVTVQTQSDSINQDTINKSPQVPQPYGVPAEIDTKESIFF